MDRAFPWLCVLGLLAPWLATAAAPAADARAETGIASYYHDSLHDQVTASGEPFDSEAMTAAHRAHAFGTRLRVTNLDNGNSVVVRVNDRGPHVEGRIIDVTQRAARLLGFLEQGVARVSLQAVAQGSEPDATGPDPRMVDREALELDWEHVRASETVRIYRQARTDSEIPTTLAWTVFDASPARILATVLDYEHFAQFIPNVKESRVLRTSGSVQWIWHRLHFPPPTVDRAYVMRSEWREARAGGAAYVVHWELVDEHPEYPARKGTLVPKAFSGFWILRSTDGGRRTEAVYAIHSDPGGALPAWLVRRANEWYLPRVVAAVRERAQQAPP